MTRQLKAEKNINYAGEYFYDNESLDDEVVKDIYEEEQGTEDEEDE